MRFTKLRLNGFKSFVDPTELVIAQGLTGVVGPNGCGKSNLLEALRWVMGESRPKAMRGGGMEDVIFAGSGRRPARAFAEVMLTIDNGDRLAPAGFNDSDVLEVVRRITRDAGSAYKTNAKDVRARDVQMLFADAATGATSPALVRQGQISELINAKPSARRRILEDAAGIAGLYQRRHEAELKLKGAESNLERVDDVIEQLAAQLAQLARQAKQAERYRRIGTDLRQAEALLLFSRWRAASDAAETAEAALREALTAAGMAERLARQAAETQEKTAEALPPLREEETVAAAVLQRVTVELSQLEAEEARATKAIGDLESTLEQLARDRSREAELNKDADETLARLASESARLAQQQDGHEARETAAEEAARIAADTLKARETALAERTEDVARLAAQHQSSERLIRDAEARQLKHQREAAQAEATAQAAQDGLAQAARETETAEVQRSAAQTASETADGALTQAEEARATAASAEAEARASRSGAEGEAQALKAEVAALERVVARDKGTGDQVLDQITVTPGFERALGAALADDLRAPVVSGPEGSGWTTLPGAATESRLSEGATCLADVVQAPEALARRLAHIGVVEDGSAAQAGLAPGQRLVSRAGDLWRWDGFRAAAADAPSAAALKLEQRNRLAALSTEHTEAQTKADAAKTAHETCVATLNAATAQDRAARDTRKRAEQALADANRALGKAENAKGLWETKAEAAALAVGRHKEEAEAAEAALSEARAAQADLPDLEDQRSAVADLRQGVDAARSDMMAARSAAEDLRRQGQGRARRAREMEKERATWSERQSTAATRAADLDKRQTKAEAALAEARAIPGTLVEKRGTLRDGRDKAEERRKAAADRLAEAEATARNADIAARDAEREAGKAREERAAAEARSEAARESVAMAADRLSEELECGPSDVLGKFEIDPADLKPAEALEDEIARLRRARDSLGAVNLRAEEDSREVQAEHDLLQNEKADLEEAIRTLRTAIASLNKEGRERLLTAFEQVDENFRMLFKHLFGGGQARLELIESDDPLDAGLEILCMPPGKKLSTLSLLSGGEQTLTALALIFAVFLANPSPICVLDEVDAPLDDANVTRFCDLLDEMTRRTETRFLIITHHAITMSRMDRLFGVTMQEQGVSQLVSVDIKKAEQLVA